MAISKVVKHKKFLEILYKTKSKKSLSRLIHSANKEQIHAILEILLNLRANNIKLTKRQEEKLRKYRRVFRLLINERSLKNQKATIIQKGGSFLPFLLKPILGILKNVF